MAGGWCWASSWRPCPWRSLVLGLALFLAWAAEATGSLALAAMADLAAVGNAWLQAPLIASFLSYAYLFFKQTGSGEVTRLQQLDQ